MLSFGEKVKKLRREKGWSQDILAKHISIHGRHVGKYESGNTLPNADTLMKMADAFDVSIDYLLRDSEDSDNPKAKIKDRDLLRAFEVMDHMKKEDKQVVKTLVEAFIKKRKIEEMIIEDKIPA